jgi:aldose 1-epimerase
VEAVADSSVSLELVHQADAFWPFGFRSAIDYLVSSRSVTVSMAITNCHDGDAPAGLGLHPFFSKARDPALSFNASGFCENGPDMLPVRLGAIPAEHDHAQPRPVRPSRLDNCFLGWDGCAAIAAGPASLIVEASEVFGNLQVFTPGWGDFFCVEPVSHVPDALSRPDLPFGQAMHVLKPNETLRGTITMTLPET